MKDKLAYLVGGEYDQTKIQIKNNTINNDGLIRMTEPFKNTDYKLNEKSGMYDQIKSPDVLLYAKVRVELRSGDDIFEFIGLDQRYS
jgi:hypothetical protein